MLFDVLDIFSPVIGIRLFKEEELRVQEMEKNNTGHL
jgi:hypothetical protein